MELAAHFSMQNLLPSATILKLSLVFGFKFQIKPRGPDPQNVANPQQLLKLQLKIPQPRDAKLPNAVLPPISESSPL